MTDPLIGKEEATRIDAGSVDAPSVDRPNLGMLRYAKDPGVRAFAIGIVILVYAVELGSSTLSIDGELLAYEPEPWRFYTPQGRWVAALLNYFAPSLTSTPFLPTALFCMGLVFVALLLASCFARSRPEAFAFVALFVSCPVWLHDAEMKFFAAEFAVALCLGAASIALIHFRGYRASIAAGIITCLALGIYQALLPFVVCGSLLSVALNIRNAEVPKAPSLQDISRRLAPFALSCVAAVLLYVGVTNVVLFLSAEELTYVTRFVRWGDFTSSFDFRLFHAGGHVAAVTPQAAIEGTIQRNGLLTGADPMFIRWRYGIVALLPVWVGVFAAIVRASKSGRLRRRETSLAAMLVLGAAVSAFVPVIVAAGMAPTRALVALPLLYAAGGASMMKHQWFGRIPQWAILSLALLTNIGISATLFNADAIARERDKIMGAEIAERLADIPGFGQDQPRMFILYGMWTHEIGGPAVKVEWFGTSFFEMDQGNPWRVESYLRLLGVRGLQPVYLTCAWDDIAEIEALPSWPAAGSVALVNEKVVIKLGPISNAQRTALATLPCNRPSPEIASETHNGPAG